MYSLYSVFKKFIIILRFYSFIFILSLRNYSEDNFSRFHEELTFMSGLLLLISGLLHMFKVCCFITIFRYLNFSLESSIYCVRKDYYLCQKVHYLILRMKLMHVNPFLGSDLMPYFMS